MTQKVVHEILHGSTVAIDGQAVLIIGPSGSGKSSLALDLMSRGATLISDDRTIANKLEDILMLSAPASIRGQIEARGIGILAADTLAKAPLRLVVDLAQEITERLPERRYTNILGVDVEVVAGGGLTGLCAAICQFLKGGRVA